MRSLTFKQCCGFVAPSVCVKQLTLVHMAPGWIVCILMRFSVEECYAVVFFVLARLALI